MSDDGYLDLFKVPPSDRSSSRFFATLKTVLVISTGYCLHNADARRLYCLLGFDVRDVLFFFNELTFCFGKRGEAQHLF